MTFAFPGLLSFPWPQPASTQRPLALPHLALLLLYLRQAPSLHLLLLLLLHLNALSPPTLRLPNSHSISLFPFLSRLPLTYLCLPVPSRQSLFQKKAPKSSHRPQNLTPILIQNLTVGELEGTFEQSERLPHRHLRHQKRTKMRSRCQ